MSKIEFKENYWDSGELKSEFIQFLKSVHNLDLTLWNNLGYWDDNYRPFSYFQDGKLISNVCVYSLDMVVDGVRKKAAQISAVGTLPEFRGQGLSSDLTRRAMEWAKQEHDSFFLFADDEAVSFYRKRGFSALEESRFAYPLQPVAGKPGARKLNFSVKSDREKVYSLAVNRRAVSDTLGVLSEKLFLFHCLYFLSNYSYYIEALDLLISNKRKDDRIIVFDIVGKVIPEFSSIYPYIAETGDRYVEFMFIDDIMGMDNGERELIREDNGAHYAGNFRFDKSPVIFPFTSRA